MEQFQPWSDTTTELLYVAILMCYFFSPPSLPQYSGTALIPTPELPSPPNPRSTPHPTTLPRSSPHCSLTPPGSYVHVDMAQVPLSSVSFSCFVGVFSVIPFFYHSRISLCPARSLPCSPSLPRSTRDPRTPK